MLSTHCERVSVRRAIDEFELWCVQYSRRLLRPLLGSRAVCYLTLLLSSHTYEFRVVTINTRMSFISFSHGGHLNLSISIRLTTGSTHPSSRLTNGSNSLGKALYDHLSTHWFKRNRLVHKSQSLSPHTHIHHSQFSLQASKQSLDRRSFR